MKAWLPLLLLIILSSSCTKELDSPIVRKYIHASHVRGVTDPEMDEEAKNIDYSSFDIVMLGGDLAVHTSDDVSTMNYLDSYFDFSNPSTLWTLGNHDYFDTSLVHTYTGRPTYYAQYQEGITYLVLDTQIDDCKIIGAQKQLFDKVLDTIQESSHLVILHHKMIWMHDHPFWKHHINAVSNGAVGTCVYCLSENNFNSELYPKLVDLKKKGIQPICIGGDVGYFMNQFEYETEEGIFFLASGFNTAEEEDKAIIFTHLPNQRVLKWDFAKVVD